MEGPLQYEEAVKIARDFVCAACGSNLLSPWGGAYGINGQVVRCFKDVDHQGVKPRGKETKFIYDPAVQGLVEYDVMAQVPAIREHPMALPDDEVGMGSRMKEALNIGKFPTTKVNGKDTPPTPQQLANLAKIALLYRLDPLMDEIMPYQGKPYITIEGRRRIDARAGHHPSIKHRPMDKDTRAMYEEMGAVNKGDMVIITELTTEFGNTIEAFGRILESETSDDPKASFLPINKWKLEMCTKRGEARARKQAYGPVALPGGMEEGDEAIEGQFREVPENELAAAPKHEPVVEQVDDPIFEEEEPTEPELPTTRERLMEMCADLGYREPQVEVILGKKIDEFLGENNDFVDVLVKVEAHHRSKDSADVA